MTKKIVVYIASYFIDGLPSMGLGLNKGRKQAIGYFYSKQCMLSFPPQLNNGNIPTLKEAAAILRGDNIILG